MSNKEKLARLTESLDEKQLAPIVSMIEAYLSALDEALDDAYCQKLLDESKNDPESHEFTPFDDFVRELRGNAK